MTPISPIELLALAVGALVLYAILIWQANVYSYVIQWQPPAGNEQMDWTLRRNLALAFGALATVIGAISSAMLFPAGPLRLLLAGQAAVMAASGSSDLRRFQIPMPLTLLGLGLAIVTIANQQLPLLVVAFGLVWAVFVILMHTLLSKGSMQLGDHLSTVWIALASPFNGLIAIVAGDAANVVLARINGLRGRKVAAAGAWLFFSAALVGLPPYLALFGSSLQATTMAPFNQPIAHTNTPIQSNTAHTLLTLTEWASDYTAGVAFADQRDERVTAARVAATHVTRLAVLARYIEPASVVAPAMSDLADALAVYDVEGVRNASQRLADVRQLLSSIVISSTSVMEQ